MSFIEIIKYGNVEGLTVDEVEEKFEAYCSWCWADGYGDCTECRRAADKLLKEKESLEQ